MREIKWYPGNEPGQRIKFKGELSKLGCCCASGCCLYPADALVNGLYTESDLPDTVMVTYAEHDPTVFTRSGDTYTGTIDDFNYTVETFLPIGGSIYQWQMALEDYGGLIETNFNCLIDFQPNYVIEDEFPDNLTMDFSGMLFSGSIVMNRISPCIWQGNGTTDPVEGESSPVICQVVYGGNPASPYKWEARWTVSGLEEEATVKDNPQNTPIGSYPTSPGYISVS